MSKRLLIFIITSLFTLYSSFTLSATRAEVAWKLIDNGAFLVDVRTPQEYEYSHLNHSVNYPLQIIDLAFNNVDKDTMIVVYCRSGNRSGQAARYLKKRGFTHVFDGGGLADLQAARQK